MAGSTHDIYAPMGVDQKKATLAVLADRSRFTPATGWNLVGIDTFEIPGEQLYLISHHGKKSEAMAAAGARPSSEKTTVLGKADA